MTATATVLHQAPAPPVPADLADVAAELVAAVDRMPPSWRELLGLAIGDAVDHLQELPDYCADCEASAPAVCAPHSADLGRAGDYLALGRVLGLEVDR